MAVYLEQMREKRTVSYITEPKHNLKSVMF